MLGGSLIPRALCSPASMASNGWYIAFWNWGNGPDDLWIAFGATLSCFWRTAQIHSQSYHPVLCYLSSKVFLHSVPFTLPLKCSYLSGCLAPWFTPVLIYLSKAKHHSYPLWTNTISIFFFSIWIGWQFSKSLSSAYFCLTIISSFLSSHSLLQAVRRNQDILQHIV